MKPDKNPFLLIPLRAIRLLLSDPDPMKETSSLTQIYYLSIYTSAMKLNVTDKDAVMQYVYCGYREQASFTLALRSAWGRVANTSGYDRIYFYGQSGIDTYYNYDRNYLVDKAELEIDDLGNVTGLIDFNSDYNGALCQISGDNTLENWSVKKHTGEFNGKMYKDGISFRN